MKVICHLQVCGEQGLSPLILCRLGQILEVVPNQLLFLHSFSDITRSICSLRWHLCGAVSPMFPKCSDQTVTTSSTFWRFRSLWLLLWLRTRSEIHQVP